jgi:tetratricopeptide (TPR) repeat protein
MNTEINEPQVASNIEGDQGSNTEGSGEESSLNTKTSTVRNLIVGVVVILIIVVGFYMIFTKAEDMPDLDRPFTTLETYPDDIRVQMEESYASAVAELKDDPTLKSRWLEIAVLRKNADDFEGAEEIWLYISTSERWEDDTTALNNLGDLYQYYLKDFAKAEEMLRTSLMRNSAEIAVYKNLHDLYRYRHQQETDLAEKVLLEGLEKNPENSIDLLVTLALYYKDTDRFEDARTRLLEARGLAETTGDSSYLKVVNTELSTLPAQ